MTVAIITENVEATLFDTFQLCHKINMPLRCIHLKFAELPKPKPADWVSRMMQAIEDALEDAEAQTYICLDGDFLILSRVVTSKTVLRLLDTLPRDLVPAPEAGLARLFEAQVDALVLIEMMQQKIKILHRQNNEIEQVKKLQLEKKKNGLQKNIELDIALNASLIPSIAARRVERKSPSILIVEDDIFSQRLVSNALKTKFEVHGATTGAQGLIAAIKAAPDIIFLDINLPDITGIETLAEILRIDPNAYIIMLSGNGSRENVMKAVQGGAKGFVGKPFTLDKLQGYIEKCPSVIEKNSRRELINA
jgi:two-component system, chemotaxis family, chemotaxis protein CheY